jgi:prepilin-type N-terminal cleavage/methylation domain-containing protein
MKRKVASYELQVASKSRPRPPAPSAARSSFIVHRSSFPPVPHSAFIIQHSAFPSASSASRRFNPSPRGFTLVEMLTVLAIVVLILATAIPVFNSLTGNHSIEAAQNQVASMLATARSDAIYNRQVTGVFFFIDPASNSVAMAEVQADPQVTGGTTYTPSTIWNGTTAANYSGYNNGPVNALEMVNYYIPPTPGGTATVGTFNYYRDVVVLPSNIGITLYNNYFGYTLAGGTYPFDRYVRVGAILFDANGTLTSVPYAVQQTRLTPYSSIAATPAAITVISQLGKRLGLRSSSDPIPTGDFASDVPTPLTGPPPYPPTSALYPLMSQAGLLFYDRNAFLNQKTTNTTDTGTSFSDQDLNYVLPSQTAYTSINTKPAADKSDEENWLDQNGIAVLVSPFNGSLITAK